MHKRGEAAESVSQASLAPVGFGLAGICALEVLAILHHPVAHGASQPQILASIVTQAGMDHVVHGALALVFGLLTVGMFVFAARIGVWRVPVLIGLTAFSCAFMLIVLAATIDGFVVPALAEQCVSGGSLPCSSDTLNLMRLAALLIEFLSHFALQALGIAMLAWAAALAVTRGLPFWVAGCGFIAAALQLIMPFVVGPRLSAANLPFVLLGQVAWCLLVAALLISNGGPFAPRSNEL